MASPRKKEKPVGNGARHHGLVLQGLVLQVFGDGPLGVARIVAGRAADGGPGRRSHGRALSGRLAHAFTGHDADGRADDAPCRRAQHAAVRAFFDDVVRLRVFGGAFVGGFAV